jgi:hypothetical protein
MQEALLSACEGGMPKQLSTSACPTYKHHDQDRETMTLMIEMQQRANVKADPARRSEGRIP